MGGGLKDTTHQLLSRDALLRLCRRINALAAVLTVSDVAANGHHAAVLTTAMLGNRERLADGGSAEIGSTPQ